MRFGLENVEPKSLRDIGKEFGVSGARVRQIELGALKSLRKPYRKGKLPYVSGNLGNVSGNLGTIFAKYLVFMFKAEIGQTI